jgi:predicted N-acetyltransferase YhbS
MNLNEFRKNSDVEINGARYTFSNQIGEDKNLLASFNKLSKSSFGISFDSVGGQYEPHVLALNGKVCSNVSVNQIPFNYRGERKFYIQLGTVMTDSDFRNKGLNRWLIEHIIDRWKNCCDGIYLFANDSVLDFYPKFGFVKMPEYEYKRSGINPNNTKVQKLRMNNEKNIHLVLKKFEQGNPFSAFYMAENQGLLSFYCMGLMKENIYYSPKYDVVIIAESEDAKTRCYDILGETDRELSDVLGEISSGVEDEIVLGFTPLSTTDFICQKHIEDDTTLFLYCSDNCLFKTDKLMFPIISHA